MKKNYEQKPSFLKQMMICQFVKLLQYSAKITGCQILFAISISGWYQESQQVLIPSNNAGIGTIPDIAPLTYVTIVS